jgi:transcriptional regulator with XRE-family HTH domain
MATGRTTLKQALRDQLREEIGDRPQASVAKAAGVSTSALSRWLDDAEDRGMKVEDLEKLAAALSLSVGELLMKAERRR